MGGKEGREAREEESGGLAGRVQGEERESVRSVFEMWHSLLKSLRKHVSTEATIHKHT